MLEELVKLFRNFIEFLQNIWEKFKQALINFLKKIKQAFVNAYHKLISFLKKYFKIIYIIIIIIICSFLYLFIYIVLNLAWYHGLFITIAIFVVLVYYISPAREEQDPQKQFRWKILLYGITWFSLTIVLLIFISYIPPTISTSFNILVLIFILLMSTVIFGAIILVYIYRLEKLGKLSVKWRFYTSLFFIAVLVCAIILGVFIGIDLFNYLTL